MSLREESDEFTRVRSALPCVSEGALEIALLLSTASKVVLEPTYGELAAWHVSLIKDGSRNRVHSFLEGLHSRSRDFARRRRSSLLVFTETDRLYTA